PRPRPLQALPGDRGRGSQRRGDRAPAPWEPGRGSRRSGLAAAAAATVRKRSSALLRNQRWRLLNEQLVEGISREHGLVVAPLELDFEDELTEVSALVADLCGAVLRQLDGDVLAQSD